MDSEVEETSVADGGIEQSVVQVEEGGSPPSPPPPPPPSSQPSGDDAGVDASASEESQIQRLLNENRSYRSAWRNVERFVNNLESAVRESRVRRSVVVDSDSDSEEDEQPQPVTRPVAEDKKLELEE